MAGDHDYKPALADHALADRVGSRYIVHHDVASASCESRMVWRRLLRESASNGAALLTELGFAKQAAQAHAGAAAKPYAARQFVQQYASVRGTWLGIGVLARRSNATRERASVRREALDHLQLHLGQEQQAGPES